MGKTKKKSTLGKTLIKDRFGSHAHHQSDSYLHTSELGDGLDWNRINLKSVTEENTLDEFLATAALAGTEFVAERLNVSIINPESHTELTAQEEEMIHATQNENKHFLKIPRRPRWDEMTTGDELEQNERESFLEWRRKLAKLQEVEGLLLTPFERNLDFWRQLWRVIERSDVIVQIVDARNPLLYRSEDLEMYVKEVSPDKVNVILINKADFLTESQRQHWADYFDNNQLKAVFWSAVLETERFKELEKIKSTLGETEDSISDEDEWVTSESDDEIDDGTDEACIAEVLPSEEGTGSDELAAPSQCSSSGALATNKNDTRLLNGDELVDFFKSFHTGNTYSEGVTTIGLVGYPNVGKSSTINAILQTKKVPVSATPGRTKHFQTLFVDKSLMLCDCPGLVMPSFVSTKAEMVINGVLPIDQMRDYIPPVAFVCKCVPRNLLEALYGIILPAPSEGEDPHRPPTAHELLGAYATMRGYMTHKGVPDFQRAARVILKDFVNGKLLFRNPPPLISVESYKPTPEVLQSTSDNVSTKDAVSARKLRLPVQKRTTSDMDRNFFDGKPVQSGQKGLKGEIGPLKPGTNPSATDKSWKKHNNQHKKNKLRRINKHLDVY